MKRLKISYYLIAFFLCCISFNYSTAQKRRFALDSLRIKVYTEIEYEEGSSKKITVTKVFCDYCSPSQIEALKRQAKELAYYQRRYSSNGRVNEIQKFTMIISVSKKDLLELKIEKDSINN